MPTETYRHPRGIYTLYFTEMWERMSYYGMRALLILYMTATLEKGGMGLDATTAGAIYGLYTCAVYLVALPGGWIADRLIGPRRAVLAGGIVIAIGHFLLAVPDSHAFFAGLIVVVLGTGLLKPNASTLVGQLYPEGGARRDAGFTLFYMGINLGAFIGPLVCGALAKLNWHYGFAAAGVGMVAGVIQYWITQRHLGEAGRHPSVPSTFPQRDWAIVATVLGVIGVVSALALSGTLDIHPLTMAKGTSLVILGTAALWFAWAFFLAKLEVVEKQRLVVLAVLFIGSAMFWSGFEQAGSVMNLFAENYTDRTLFGPAATEKWREFPAGWYQSLNSLFVLLLAVPVSMLWLALAKRQIVPSLPVKFGTGLLLLAAGFLVMYFGSIEALAVGKVGGIWLFTTYLLHTIGELFLSPVGLSAVTKLTPAKLASQAMGVWFLAASLGNLIAGLFAGEVTGENTAAMPARFMLVVMITGGTGLLMLLCARPIRKLMAGVE